MRAMKSYDKITFKNNFDIEEFVITIFRDETLEGINEGVNSENDTINLGNDTINDTINFENEGINSIFEGINEGIKNDLLKIYSYLQKNELVKHADIKQIVNKSDATIERYLKTLKDNGLIEYVGSKKTGGYKVITKK